MLAEHWFYRLDGRPHGPFTPMQFEKLIRGHTVTLDTEVSSDGRTWKTLRATMTGEPPDESPPTDADWMNAPTLLPNDPRTRRTEPNRPA